MKKGESSVRIFSQNKALAEQKVTNSSKEYKNGIVTERKKVSFSLP